MEDNFHIENVYAYNEDFKEIYIGNVPAHENGIKKNYYCLGCRRQMQAVKGNIRKQHFKHHVKPHSTEKKCIYRDETYRHKLAKDIIQLLRRVKVPPVYKTDPDKKSMNAYLIRGAQFIEAHEILIERYIYENQNGEIKIEQNKDQSKHLLIKPDIIFLNENRRPILIIEFVVTHKPDIDKLIKLKRLGVDAIQIAIPKSSPEEIEKSFSITKYTKWLFNNEESNTDYIQFSNQYSGAIFEIDQEQRKLLEEGYKCRSAEIGDLIRTIERMLETEQYKRVEQNIRSTIFRVEENTRREESELEELRAKYSESGIDQHSSRREKLRAAETELIEEETDIQTRYFAKRAKLIEQDKLIEQEIAEFEYQSTEVIRTGNSTSDELEREKESTKRIREELAGLGPRKDEYRKSIQLGFEENKESIESDIRRIQSQIQGLQESFDSNRNKLENDYRTSAENLQQNILREQEQSNQLRERFESKFIADKERVLHELEKGENSSDRGITRECEKFHAFSNALLVYKSALERNERAREGN
ncbi:MAG: hypothetical protein ACO1N0_12110 [Fluviicola sp.]